MATKETAELIIEAIDYYLQGICPDGKIGSSDIDIMKKLIKYDDIKNSLNKKED